MKDFWEQNGKEWVKIIDEQRIASRKVTNSAVLAEIQSLSPKSILDIGCGEGWLARELSENIRYFGVDGSQNLIQSAKDKNKKQKFSVVSYEAISKNQWNPDEKMDLVVFNFALLEKDIGALLKNSADFLTTQGRMVIQTLHPHFSTKTYCDQWNEDDFSSVSADVVGKMPWFQRTLQSWTELFVSSGLVIEKITEPMLDAKPASLMFTLRKSQN